MEHALLSIENIKMESWQEWEAKSFFKEIFSFEINFNSFEIKAISFFKELFSFKQNRVLKTKTHYSTKHHHNFFYILKFHFHLRQSQVGISMSPFHLKSQPSLVKSCLALKTNFYLLLLILNSCFSKLCTLKASFHKKN